MIASRRDAGAQSQASANRPARRATTEGEAGRVAAPSPAAPRAGRARAASAASSAAPAPRPPRRQRQHRQRRGERGQQHRQHRRQALRAEGDEGVHGQRIRVIGEHHGGAELAEGAQPGQQQPGPDHRPGEPQAHAQEPRAGRMAEGRGDVLQRRIDAGKALARGDDQERRGDERLGGDDPGKLVGDAAEQPAERRVGAEQEQQQNAARQRRQCQRQLHQEPERRDRPPAPARQQEAERNAAHGHQRARQAGAGHRDQRGAPDRGPVRTLPVAAGQRREAGQQRCREIEGQQPGEQAQRRRAAPLHRALVSTGRRLAGTAAASPVMRGGTSSSPCCRSSARPSAPNRKATNRAAPAGSAAPRGMVTV